ncbi:MAG: three-Cys-motif partner protein TcmP [Chitinophagaceae bacterium]|nr:three-Cys-motif partner protein TcmP [Chitinophagaceae bacterium]
MPSLESFNEPKNGACLGSCKKQDREEYTEDSICQVTASEFDNYPVRCVGEWAKEKIHFLTRYFDIFAKGMAYKWEGNINYIEICSGPGICIDRSTRKELLGTALSIAQLPSFDKLFKAVFIDINQDIVDNLNSRFEMYGKSGKAIACFGDYTQPDQLLSMIRGHISAIGLNLVFFDPVDCSVPFNTIVEIKKRLKNCDLIINVFYGLDPRRWLGMAFENPEGALFKKYARFLGADSFLFDPEVRTLHQAGNHDEVHRRFIDFYKAQLRSIGFEYFAHEPIRNYYEMLFASSNERGIDFWKKITKVEEDGQKRLF